MIRRMNRYLAPLAFLAAMAASGTAAAGGPLGIDHRVHYDNSGIWKRGNQNALMYGTIATVGIGALAFGSEEFPDEAALIGDFFSASFPALADTTLRLANNRIPVAIYQCLNLPAFPVTPIWTGIAAGPLFPSLAEAD